MIQVNAGAEPKGQGHENYLRGFGPPAIWTNFETSAPDIRLDINEDEKIYRVRAEIPGVDKKDIDISIDGNQVAVSTEVKRESKKKESEKEVYSERYYGHVYRSFSLPTDVDSAKAEARYENGVLTMTLPKKSNGAAHKISVGCSSARPTSKRADDPARVEAMPYATNIDLPPHVRDHLASRAQDKFREAFNHAWTQYAEDVRREEIAFRVAWAAVKKAGYRKLDGEWAQVGSHRTRGAEKLT